MVCVVVQDVPSMGDSITEGVVEEYVKSKFTTAKLHIVCYGAAT